MPIKVVAVRESNNSRIFARPNDLFSLREFETGLLEVQAGKAQAREPLVQPALASETVRREALRYQR